MKRVVKKTPDYIEKSIAGLAVPIGSVKLDDANARQHPVRNLEAIKTSLKTFKQQKPIIVDERGVVIAGNGTLIAAKELGWKFIAVVKSSLKDFNRTAFAIADNKTAELAEWDYEALSMSLRAMAEQKIDLTTTGFADFEIDPLLIAEWKPPKMEPDEIHAPGRLLRVEFNQEQMIVVEAAIAKVRTTRDGATAAEALVEVCRQWGIGH